MEADVGLEIVVLALRNDLAVLVFVEFVDHDSVVAGEFADVCDDGIAEKLDVAAREGLETGDGADGELLGLDGAGDGEAGVFGAGGL